MSHLHFSCQNSQVFVILYNILYLKGTHDLQIGYNTQNLIFTEWTNWGKKTIKQSSEAPAIKSKYENVKISIDTKNILNSDKNIFKCKKGRKDEQSPCRKLRKTECSGWQNTIPRIFLQNFGRKSRRTTRFHGIIHPKNAGKSPIMLQIQNLR